MKRRIIGVLAFAALSVVAYRCSAQLEMRTSEAVARSDAMDKLLAQVRELKLKNGKALGDALDAAKPDIPRLTLLKGVERLAVPRYHDTGECRMILRIQQKQLQQNIEQVYKQYMPEAIDLNPDSLPKPDEYVVADVRTPQLMSRRGAKPPTSEPPTDLAGWAGIDALDRNTAEHTALKTAKDGVVAKLTALLADAPRAEGVKANLPAIVDDLLPTSRCYLAGAIVEMTQSVTPDQVIKAIRSDNDKLPADKKLTEPELAEIAKKLGPQAITVTTCASVSGAPCDEKELGRYAALTEDDLRGSLPKPTPKTEARTETKPEEKAAAPIKVELAPPAPETRPAPPATGESRPAPAKSEK